MEWAHALQHIDDVLSKTEKTRDEHDTIRGWLAVIQTHIIQLEDELAKLRAAQDKPKTYRE